MKIFGLLSEAAKVSVPPFASNSVEEKSIFPPNFISEELALNLPFPEKFPETSNFTESSITKSA